VQRFAAARAAGDETNGSGGQYPFMVAAHGMTNAIIARAAMEFLPMIVASILEWHCC